VPSTSTKCEWCGSSGVPVAGGLGGGYQGGGGHTHQRDALAPAGYALAHERHHAGVGAAIEHYGPTVEGGPGNTPPKKLGEAGHQGRIEAVGRAQ